MNREGLKAFLRSEGVLDDAYVLEGDPYLGSLDAHPHTATGVWVMRIVPGGWAVSTYERGSWGSEEKFDTEDEACSELLDDSLPGSGDASSVGAFSG